MFRESQLSSGEQVKKTPCALQKMTSCILRCFASDHRVEGCVQAKMKQERQRAVAKMRGRMHRFFFVLGEGEGFHMFPAGQKRIAVYVTIAFFQRRKPHFL